MSNAIALYCPYCEEIVRAEKGGIIGGSIRVVRIADNKRKEYREVFCSWNCLKKWIVWAKSQGRIKGEK